MLTWDQWWQQFSVQAIGGTAGTLLAAALLSAVSKTVRERFWKPIGRGLWWLTTIRLTTTGRVRAAREDANQMIREVQAQDSALIRRYEGQAAASKQRALKAQLEASAERAKREKEVAAAKVLANDEKVQIVRNNQRLVELVREQGRAEGRAEAEAELARQRAAPLTLPTWRIRPNEGAPGSFTIENVEPKGEASDVELAAAPGDFAFDSSARWDGLFLGTRVFKGQRMGVTGRMPVRFSIRYRDARGDWRGGEAVLAAPRTGAISSLPRVAKMGPDDPLGPLKL